MFNATIDVIRGNMVYEKSTVVDANTFTGNWQMLMSGAETPCEWDENGNVTAYAVLSSQKEYREEADELFAELGL